MMSKAKKFGLFGAIIGILFAATACHRSPEHRVEHMVEHATDRYDLSDEQRGKLQEVIDTAMAAGRQMHEAHAAKKQALMEMLVSDSFDKTLVKQTLEDAWANIDALSPAVIDKLAAFHASLTPEQRGTIAEDMEKHKRKHHHFH